jgi:23S rRNA (pseudouridine1915-N3)-methyltransferase
VKVAIVAIGQRQPRWADDAVADYLDRFPADFAVTLKEVKPEGRSGRSAAQVLGAEAKRLRATIPAGSRLIALDERGDNWTTKELADAMRRWRDSGDSVCFLIGGPDGLDPQIKAAADLRLRLSSLTLPHALARVLLVEQLYRVWSMLANHPYHRA